MADALAASLVGALASLELGGTRHDAGNGVSFDGVTLRSNAGGVLEIGVRSFEAHSLRLGSGRFVLEIGRAALRELVVQLGVEEGAPRLRLVEAAGGELSGVKAHGPLILSPKPQEHSPASHVGPAATGATAAGPPAADALSLGPLALAEGTIRAQIVDAHLMFDADVTVPIRRGGIDFNDATVEHVGPDSSMGVSRLGLYVDAPNGRSYVYQFPSTPIAGVHFERRNALLGAWVANRGSLALQAFAEGLLRQGSPASGAGFTDEARLLFERTAVSGDVQLSEGTFCIPGLKADLAGRAEGSNAVRLRSKAVGRGLTVEMPALSVRNAALTAGGTRLECDALMGALVLRVLRNGAQLRFELDVPKMELSGLRVLAAA